MTGLADFDDDVEYPFAHQDEDDVSFLIIPLCDSI
jgi:hypothetical protein